MIVFDASTLVGAAIVRDGVPRRALGQARRGDIIGLSIPVRDEIASVLRRPRLARFIDVALLEEVLDLLIPGAAWFQPDTPVSDCRDPADNKYLELALASKAAILISSDADLLTLDPWRGIRILRAADYLAADAGSAASATPISEASRVSRIVT